MNEDILNNLPGLDVVEEISPEAMSTDRQLPPPDGDYTVLVSLIQNGAKPEKQYKPIQSGAVGFFVLRGRDGKPDVTHFNIFLEEQLVDAAGNNVPGGRRRIWPSTMPQGEGATRTTEVDTLLRALTGQAGVGLTSLRKIELLHQLLATGPQTLQAVTEWIGEANKPDKKKPGEERRTIARKEKRYLAGMNNFPTNEQGQPMAVEEDDDGDPVFMGWRVKKYQPKLS